MSRIQQILDKAEREGNVRRLRDLSAEVVASPAAPPPRPAVDLPPHESRSAPAHADVPAGIGRGHAVSGLQLHPRLIAATSPSAQQSEQYRRLRTRLLHAESGSMNTVVLVTS